MSHKPFKNFTMVPKVVFGAGSFSQLPIILEAERKGLDPFIYLIDDVFKNKTSLLETLSLKHDDAILFISADLEPKTTQVDALVLDIKTKYSKMPSGIIGIGGGTMMDLAKAVSLLLTNPGKAEDYQGWDLIKNKGIYHVGIPTISGTGAEVSRTTVLNGPNKKLGINSDYTPFDQVILDPQLTQDVPKEQWFYTGMDCFIHCIESLNGTFINAFSESHGEKALDLCLEIFLNGQLNPQQSKAKLMMASWHGGMSIAYSQVGIAHAMSYGLSYVLDIKHGLGNCIVFNHLHNYYPEGVALFKKIIEKNNICIPQNVCANISPSQLNTMIDVALSLTPLWENALGADWKTKINRNTLENLYQNM